MRGRVASLRQALELASSSVTHARGMSTPRGRHRVRTRGSSLIGNLQASIFFQAFLLLAHLLQSFDTFR